MNCVIIISYLNRDAINNALAKVSLQEEGERNEVHNPVENLQRDDHNFRAKSGLYCDHFNRCVLLVAQWHDRDVAQDCLLLASGRHREGYYLGQESWLYVMLEWAEAEQDIDGRYYRERWQERQQRSEVQIQLESPVQS